GTCRNGLHGRPARAWRLRTADLPPAFESNPANVQAGRLFSAIEFIANGTLVRWHDRRLGAQQQDVAAEVGDFVLRRADGLWAYQLAVVVDDAAQGITDVVRGEDLADNTPRQIRLQQLLGLPTPSYLHTPLVLGPNGEKLSKQNGAEPLDLGQPLAAFKAAAHALGLDLQATTLGDARAQACAMWAGSPISGMMPA
ncbi:MAG: tRNA glutamyl-Q(34) synthetase GluQRS, partial [Paucibacter sp.]|nr:tRNA glutamyl-Q(34) synthetase GluQRS [Roseateles sp.]